MWIYIGLDGNHGALYNAAFDVCSLLLHTSHGDLVSISNILCRGLMSHIAMSYGAIKGIILYIFF